MSFTSTPKRYKAKKAKDWQKVQYQTEKRLQKGEQKVHQGIDKSSTTFGYPIPYQRLASN